MPRRYIVDATEHSQPRLKDGRHGTGSTTFDSRFESGASWNYNCGFREFVIDRSQHSEFIVKGSDTADSFVSTNTGQYLSQRGDTPLTSIDFIQSTAAYEQAESQSNDYPKSIDGLFLPQQL
ncbi:uncharacterized protein METZ01_LOCUS416144 [marine metagenome]|uniref:Uncharacterized protein n=1 Tax=marine metagenome TaxID=408172 RepID=A0A382WXK6_9ZZZZ